MGNPRNDMKLASLLLSLAGLACGQVDPAARCPDATPTTASCCYSNKSTAVMGGIDFFDLAGKKQGTDSPVQGSPAFTAELSGYTFHFVSAANRDGFNQAPWAYAPAWGGF